MIRRELIEGSQSKEAEQVEPGQANSPHEDILRHPLAFSGASSQDISSHAGPGTALLEWNEKDNRQIDQQASTSGSGLKQGEPDQVTGKRKRATEYFAALINLPEARDAVFQKFDLPDIIMAYQSFDEGYKILGSLDDKKRQKVIDNLKGSELAEHFALLKTSDERKQFLGWIGLEDWGTLYECYGGDSKKLKKFLGELNIEQIEQLINQVRSNHETEENEHEIKQLCEALPLEDLKVLIDKSVVEYPEYEARLHAEYFNTLETYNEKKGFVRHLDIVQIKNLYTYFKDDSKERKELCRAMPWEDLNLLAETVPGEHFEHWARTYAEEFSVLEESSDRRRFLEGFTTEELIRLYRYFDDDPDKQNLLCRSIPLKHLRSIIEEITYEESEVARSYLTKVNGI